jgi:hypothetical protein
LTRSFPFVSVVINNFNYAEFLPEAIESALCQRDVRVEVIVVDDGSADDSRKILRGYGRRLRAVLKENGGQASAFNAGFDASRGDIVIFLDADDGLFPDTAARVSECFRRRPELVKVHYRLEVVDAHARPTGDAIPPAAVPLAYGDLRKDVVRSPDDIPYPPTSGNAFASNALRRVLPMPEAEYRSLADVYLSNLVSLLGPVDRLDGLGGFYRVHDRNAHFRSGVDLERIRSTICATRATHRHLAALAPSVGVQVDEDPASLTDLAQRLVSKRLDPTAHPFHGDRSARLAARGLATALGRSDKPWRRRLAYAGWFAACAVVPRAAVRWLAAELFEAWRSGSLLHPPRR